MTIWPDFKKIVGLETVTIPDGTVPAERERLVFSRLAHLFWRMSGMIAGEATGSTRDHRGRQKPASDAGDDELKR